MLFSTILTIMTWIFFWWLHRLNKKGINAREFVLVLSLPSFPLVTPSNATHRKIVNFIKFVLSHLRTTHINISFELHEVCANEMGKWDTMKDELRSLTERETGWKDFIQISLNSVVRNSLGRGPRADHWYLQQTIRMFYKTRFLFCFVFSLP